MWDDNADLALAIQLQNELNNEDMSCQLDTKHEDGSKLQSLVDPIWELIDPNPDARDLFLQFNDRYFWGKLSAVEVRWSPRMTLCAGVCVYEGRGGLCSVRLSLPLLKLRPRKDLVETLLHEMIHAYLFVTDNNKDHDGHGPEFHKHMYRINADAGTNITVYHTFHDEVDNYRQHWWKCDGPCQKRPPYYGYLKRAVNRAPSARDPWWNDHQQKCGGAYIKVKEPEGYGKKKGKKKDSEINKAKAEAAINTADICNLFSGKTNAKSPGKLEKPNLPALPNTKSSNIAGFVKGDKGNELKVYSDNPNAGGHRTMSDPFPGKGISLATSNWDKSPLESSHIVRKLPGVGVIQSERPKQKGIETNNGMTTNDDSDDDILIYSPGRKQFSPTSKQTFPKKDSLNSSSKTDIRSWMNKERKMDNASVLTFSDSDSEFDALLLKATDHQKKSSSGSKTMSIPKGNEGGSSEINSQKRKVLPAGFQSVCRQNTAESKKNVENKVYEIRSDSDLSAKSRGYSAQRNKRAHDLGSSSSDSDIDAQEKMSLMSVIRKKRKKSEQDSSSDKSFAHTSPCMSSSVHDKAPACVQPTSSFMSSGFNGSFSDKKYGQPTVSSQDSKHIDFSSKGVDKLTSASQVSKHLTGSGSKILSIDCNEDLVPCPVCSTLVKSIQINEHLDSCLT